MPGDDTGLSQPPAPPAPRGERDAPPARWLARLAQATFALYLILLLGANGVAASRGPLAWLPLVRLPAADNAWVLIGVVGLLPLLSVAAWLSERAARGRLRALRWGPRRVVWPLLALAGLGALSLAGQCAGGECDPTAAARLVLLLAHLAWVYLYVVNERPPLLPIIAAVILLQSTVALGQFITQRELGLALLGEPALDPQLAGISVVMRGAERWLRAYGLTNHPNVLAGTLVPLLLLLPVLAHDRSLKQRRVLPLLLALACAALFSTLAPMQILISQTDAKVPFKRAEGLPDSLVNKLTPIALTAADVNGDDKAEIIVAKDQLARAFRVRNDGKAFTG